MKRATAARAILVLDINNLLDPLKMRRQRTAVGLARLPTWIFARFIACVHGLRQSSLGFLQGKLELIGIELFRTTTETMTLQRVNDRSEAFDFCLENRERIKLASLLKD
jgi:hypothetical protein